MTQPNKPVSQRAKEAAADAYTAIGRGGFVAHVRDGLEDDAALVQAFASFEAETIASLSSEGDRETWRHVKRGTVYDVIGRAELQLATGDVVEGSELVIYRGEDGKLWARERGEFEDGRFERIITSTPSHAETSEERLARFFREERPAWGFEGDVEGWSPVESALHFLRACRCPQASTPSQSDVIEKCGDALKAFAQLERSITADVSTAHSLRGEGASSEMRSDDRDMRADLRHAFGLLHIALASKEGQHHGQG